MKTFAKIYHDIARRSWYTNNGAVRLYLHLALNASHAPAKVRGVDIPAGSVVASLPDLAEALKLPYNTVRAALTVLRRAGDITLKGLYHCTLITLTDPDDQPDTLTAPQQPEIQHSKSKIQNSPAQQPEIQHSTFQIQNSPAQQPEIQHSTFQIPNPPAVRRLVDLWNESCPALTPVKVCTGARRKKIAERLRQFDDPDKALATFADVFARCRSSAFLNGRNARHWKVTFDWLMADDTNWVKVWEGRYDDPAPEIKTESSTLIDTIRNETPLPASTQSANLALYPGQAPGGIALYPGQAATGYIAGAYGLPASRREIEQAKSNRAAAELIADCLADPFATNWRSPRH